MDLIALASGWIKYYTYSLYDPSVGEFKSLDSPEAGSQQKNDDIFRNMLKVKFALEDSNELNIFPNFNSGIWLKFLWYKNHLKMVNFWWSLNTVILKRNKL